MRKALVGAWLAACYAILFAIFFVDARGEHWITLGMDVSLATAGSIAGAIYARRWWRARRQ